MPTPSGRPREPIFTGPPLVLGAIGAMLALHAVRQLLSPERDFALLLSGGFIPAQWSVLAGRLDATDVVNAATVGTGENAGELGRAMANLVLGSDIDPGGWEPFTYACLHASWTHVVLNSVWLLAFATPVVRRAGAARSIALAFLTAAAGAGAHWLVHPASVTPLIGASAVVSGFMAAAATFVFDPGADLHGREGTRLERARASLMRMSRNRTVLIFLGSWLVLNFLSAFITGPLGIAEASIAWEAHLGGFLAALLVFPLIDPGRGRPQPV